MNTVSIDLYNLFMPVVQLFRNWLEINVSFAGTTFPLWAVICFVLLVSIFIRVLASLGAIIVHYAD